MHINLSYTAAAAQAGPTSLSTFMSPYQQDVIDATLQEFDIQAQKGLGQLQHKH